MRPGVAETSASTDTQLPGFDAGRGTCLDFALVRFGRLCAFPHGQAAHTGF